MASVLLKCLTYTCLPDEIESDQGTNVMIKLIQQVLSMLDIPHICSAALHCEYQGAIERFHQWY